MKLSDFRYTAPKSITAKYPAEPRDHAKLLVLDRKTGEMDDRIFSDITEYFKKGDCLVVNESRVFPARLIGKKEKTNAQIEVMLLRELSQKDTSSLWDVIVDPARKVRIGNKIYFDDGKLYCEVIDNTTSRGRTVRFNHTGDLFKTIERIGLMPLPPYIGREPTGDDRDYYQTIFARVNGSVAAPTAGLHFSKRLLARLERKGVKIARIMLHINRSTFDPVEVEDLTKHKMHSEYFEISTTAADTINSTIKGKGNVFAVGASVVRALESSVLTVGTVKPNRAWTDKFIYPPYDFKIVDRLITNFHPPESTVLMMVCAFAGRERVMKAYKQAIKGGYRFYSYGDAMLVI
ncbi:MAG: tRNA preQ1(34) S-adenosylmethionine ribosyltransferase-isomerase QueA [Bacteroidetes bacterium]|nr:tRNA preQ1(34) S-adenosylmethionine ribosyltransferase-isomerase QueA [Bacteroidota bacterium]HVZ40361.1 tRNA preQ1(34) S-adenosylmethionine ribosyltransferase-isomerase QueA [Candidatus Kapabacteria bacterium]